ncbi:MAG: SNF2 helicase associated domain-containing protein, partial [Lachnospiraceae bacterium]|nr:SNF2 helicase associated domain-containing protein [Lachnospiraceae bacterium]
YRVLSKGVDELLAMGEVRCTKRFSSLKITKKIRMSVGVSVSSGLLDLDIATEDLPVEELLEVLNSYNSRKKYHRLKNGDFLDMEDNSYEMLSEMMASLHLSPKDFIKGNVKVPLYRTLYLDKLLEENENVYSERDRHFKNLVRGFKTVNDSDFQLPSALARVLRNYQKNGYRWLRTLENFQFGGILADDMGLGKTLQVIAVLLSAKQEGRKGVSLVVAPASLVFNWGEEIHKFAPELTFSLISGTQEERRRKLEDYEEADVLVTSYDLLKRDASFYEGKEFLYQIIDEAQYIKNHQTVAAKAVKVIKSQTRFALTGTPIENRLSELWSIFDYLMPGFLYKYEVFRREIEAPIVKNQDETAMERLKKMTAPFILRRLKA